MAEQWSMKEFIRPDKPSGCTWHLGADPKDSPHTKRPLESRSKILPDVLHAIGDTHLVRLNHIPKKEGLKCELLAKCEFFNPGGSVKDRIGYRMVQDAEEKGLLKPGYTIIEPTSGNTGIGLAMAAAVKGYRCIIVMPMKMSDEKVNVLKALGAEIIRTPTMVSFDSEESLVAVAQKLNKKIPNSIILNQYMNPGNPLAHYDKTGAEIIRNCDGKLDMVVIGAGTGGTITGIARQIKENCPNCKIIGVDPVGSILAVPEQLNKSDVKFVEMEGIGYDFLPTVLDRHVVDKWYKVTDEMALPMSRRLIREEGLLCGGSSGAAMAIAVKAAAELKEGQRCVVILPDSIRNYLTKFVSDQWLEVRNLKPLVNTHNHWWWNMSVQDLGLKRPFHVKPTTSCLEAKNLMKKLGVQEIAAVDGGNNFAGITTMTKLTNTIVNGDANPKSPIEKIFLDKIRKVNQDTCLGMVSKILEKDPFAVVIKDHGEQEELIGVITINDIADYVTGEVPQRKEIHKNGEISSY